jgi:hypothetical protein
LRLPLLAEEGVEELEEEVEPGRRENEVARSSPSRLGMNL